MRAFAVLALVLLGISCLNNTSRAEQSDNCKQCRDQQRACTSNYSSKTCKSEYDICMKSCRKTNKAVTPGHDCGAAFCGEDRRSV